MEIHHRAFAFHLGKQNLCTPFQRAGFAALALPELLAAGLLALLLKFDGEHWDTQLQDTTMMVDSLDTGNGELHGIYGSRTLQNCCRVMAVTIPRKGDLCNQAEATFGHRFSP